MGISISITTEENGWLVVVVLMVVEVADLGRQLLFGSLLVELSHIQRLVDDLGERNYNNYEWLGTYRYGHIITPKNLIIIKIKMKVRSTS